MLYEVVASLLIRGTNAVQASTVAPQPAEPIGINWIVIALLLIVVFLWSPKRIPELARSLGQAKREFDKAMHDVSTAASTSPLSESVDNQLLNTAKKLGIATEGKTADQISQEIVSKAQPK